MGGGHAAHGFFFYRERLDFGLAFASETVELQTYVNLPSPVGAVVSAGTATLIELQTVYGTEDLYDLLEVVMVDAYNHKMIMKAQAQ